MSRDSILVWILILLVGTSLFLSFNIWSQVPGKINDDTHIAEGKKVDLASVANPGKLLVHLGGSICTVITPSSPLYESTLDFTKKTLASKWAEKKPEPTIHSQEYFIDKKGIEAFFSTPLPANFIKRLLDIKPFDSTVLDGMMVKSYLIVEDQGVCVYLRDNNDKYFLISQDSNQKELTLTLDKISNSNPILFAELPSGNQNLKIEKNIYVSLTPFEMSIYLCKDDEIVSDRIAAKFFPDFSITRKIEEKDEAVIYTDGQRGLRVYSDGALEYSFPGVKEQKKSTNFYDALNTAVNFINAHGGWPRDGFLSSFEVVEYESGSYGYSFSFQMRIDGYPLVMEKDYITITVEGTQVRNFYRKVPNIDRPKQHRQDQIISPIKALDMAVLSQKIEKVDNIYQAYTVRDDLIIPVWIIESSNKKVFIQAYMEW